MANATAEKPIAQTANSIQQQNLVNLRYAQRLFESRKADHDLIKTLQSATKLNGEYYAIHGAKFSDIFRSLFSSFDPNYHAVIPKTFSQKEIAELMEHFEQMARFESRLETAIVVGESLQGHPPETSTEDKRVSDEENEAFKKSLDKENKAKSDEAKTAARNQGIGVPGQEQENIWVAKEEGGEVSDKAPTNKTPPIGRVPSSEPLQATKPTVGQRLRIATKNIHPGRLGGLLQGAWLPVRGHLNKHLTTRVIPALALGAIGATQFGPAGLAAGLVVGYLGGQTAFEGRGQSSPSGSGTSPAGASSATTRGEGAPVEQSPGTLSQQPIPPTPRRPKSTRPLGNNGLGTATNFLTSSITPSKKYVIIFFIVFTAIVLFMMLLTNQNGSGGFGGGGGATSPTTTSTGQATVSKEQRDCRKANESDDFCTINNGDDITYDITVTYQGSEPGDVEVSDKIDPQTQFKEASDGGQADSTGVVKWLLKSLSPGQSKNISLTVHPQSPDIWVVNNLPAAIITNATGGDINECVFYGANGGLKIGSPSLATLINDIASKVGVPSPVLAGIIRIESQDSFKSTDSSYLTHDWDDHASSQGAVGIAQFLPDTFAGVFNDSKNKPLMDNLFNKTSVDTTKYSYSDFSQKASDTSVLRIVSVKDSITAAAFYIKMLANNAPWNEGTIRKVAEGYQGACAYPAGVEGSYCDDLVKDAQTCQLTAPPIAGSGYANALASIMMTSSSCQLRGSAIVYSGDKDACFASIQPLPDLVNKTLTTSVNNYGYLQCVGFVKAAVAGETGQELDDHGVGNACDYYWQPPTGYQSISSSDTSATIQVGDIAVWGCHVDNNRANNFPNGHVAVVVSVISNDRFRVAEANYAVDGWVNNTREVNRDEFDLLGWVRKQ